MENISESSVHPPFASLVNRRKTNISSFPFPLMKDRGKQKKCNEICRSLVCLWRYCETGYFFKNIYFFWCKRKECFCCHIPQFFRDLTINSVALKENTRKLCWIKEWTQLWSRLNTIAQLEGMSLSGETPSINENSLKTHRVLPHG